MRWLNKILSLYHKYDEVIRYLFIGVLSTIVNLVTKFLLLFIWLDAKVELELQLAIIVSWIVAVIFAYVTNRKIVFRSKNNNLFKEVRDFFLSRVVTLVLEMFLMWFFVNLLKLNTDMWVMIITVIVQFLVIVGNYIFSKLFVFKKEVM